MKILLVDDHGLVRDALKAFLQELRNDCITFEAETFEQSLTFADDGIDLILLDFNLPDSNGYDAFKQLQEIYNCRIVMLSGENDYQLIENCMNMGVDGFVHKSSKASILVSAINIVLNGERYFPSQFSQIQSMKHSHVISQLPFKQRKICRLALTDGLSNKEIAIKLNLAESTIKTVLSICYDKLGIKGRKEGRVLFS